MMWLVGVGAFIFGVVLTLTVLVYLAGKEEQEG